MKIKTLALGVTIFALVIFLFFEKKESDRRRAALAQKNEVARVETGQDERKGRFDPRANEQVEAEHAELMRLRAQAAAFREAQRDLTNARAQISQLRSTLETARSSGAESPYTKLAEGMKGVGDFRNLGNLTATDSFETALWAASIRDTNVLARSITFDEETRARAEELLANAPDVFRNRFENVEQLVAFMMSKTTPLVGMRVFEEEPISPGKIRLQTEWQYSDGRVQPNSFSFFQADNGQWQMVIESGMMYKLGRMMDEEAAAMRARKPM